MENTPTDNPPPGGPKTGPAGAPDVASGHPGADPLSAATTDPGVSRAASSGLRPFYLPLALSGVWIAACVAYILGFATLYAAPGASLPYLNLVLLALAGTGPLALIWGITLILRRSGRFAAELSAQTEAARDLTRQLARFEPAIAHQAAAVEKRLGELDLTVEKTLQANLAELSGVVAALTDDAADMLLNRNAELDDRVTRSAKTVTATLAQKFQDLDNRLRSVSRAIDQHAAAQQAEMSKLVETRIAGFSQAGADAEARLVKAIEARIGAVEAKMTASSEELDRQTETLFGARIEALETTLARMQEAIEKTQAAVTGKTDAAAARLDTSLSEETAFRRELIAEQKKLLEVTLPQRIEALASGAFSGLETSARETVERLTAQLTEAEKAAADSLTRHAEKAGTDFAALEAAFARLAEAQEKRLTEDLPARMDQLATGMQEGVKERLDTLQGSYASGLDAALAKSAERLQAAIESRAEALDRQSAILETTMPEQLGKLRERIEQIDSFARAHPPADETALITRLGQIAASALAPEREKIADLATRISEQEQLVREMLHRIDRDQRLNIAGRQTSEAAPATQAAPPGLPFSDLPDGGDGSPDWSSILDALELPSSHSPIAQALKRAAFADREVTELLELGAGLQDALAAEGLFLADLTLGHAPDALWRRYLTGELGKAELSKLRAFDDEVPLALTRAKLRREEAFRETGLRFASRFQRLLGRLADRDAFDGRLPEVMETACGRAYLLLSQSSGAFDRPEE